MIDRSNNVEDVEEEACRTLGLIKNSIDLLKLESAFDFSSLHESIEVNADRSRELSQSLDRENWPIAPSSSVHQIPRALLSLSVNLGCLYEVMDEAANSTPANEEFTSNINQTGRRKKSAPPPPGLLSLRNYTDICVMVEIIVCTTILPALPSNVLLPVEDRLRYQVPQSVTGRLDQRKIQDLYKLERDRVSMDPTMDEYLSHVISVLGRLLLLDRFRPMLFPRHRTDLCAAILFLQHGKSGPRGETYDPHLLRLLGLSNNESSANHRLESIAQAQTYQALLRYGRQAPIWLRRQVGERLQHLAATDLGAVLLVFVASAPERSAAAQRLALALQSDNQRIIPRLIRLLDSIGEQMEQKEAESIVYTIWAVIAAGGESVVVLCAQELAGSLEQLIPRMERLWSIPPPKVYLGYRLLFSAVLIGGEHCSLLGLLVRIAAQRSVLHSTARFKVVAVWQKIQETADSKPNRDALAVGLLQSLAPCTWDATYEVNVKGDAISTHRREGNSLTLEQRIRGVEQRTTCACQLLLKQDQLIAFSFFRSVLVCYVSATSPLPGLDEITPLVILPMVCENMPMESLLTQDENTGLFTIMQIVFSHVSSTKDDISRKEAPLMDSSFLQGFMDYAKCIGKSYGPIKITRPADSSSEALDTLGKGEILMSIASVLLSILVSILELGSSTRCETDEAEIRSLACPLQNLSSGHASAGECQNELAEMASHALALLQSRSVHLSAPKVGCTISERWEQARKDLESSEPPLRARGVVTLRNLANGLSSAPHNYQVSPSDLLQASIQALGDDESYVYLAAIHTVVAIAAAEPSCIMPLLSSCFITGSLETGNHSVELSMAQRAKLTEAISFIVRRRIALGDELPRLLQLLCYGPRDETTPLISVLDVNQEQQVHEATHNYFVGKNEERKLDEQQYWDETELRVRTGGPLFSEEESDLVRSGRILIASELVGVLDPAQLSSHVAILIDCCIDALRLEVSRPVRRAAASLAREIYAAVVRVEDDNVASYAKAIVTGRHDTLAVVLERCIAGADLGDIEHRKLFDEATAARCREAIDQVAHVGSILSLATIAVEEDRQQAKNPISRLLLDEPSAKGSCVKMPLITKVADSDIR